jgi:DNA-binding PadR family transcriptional regulator
MHAHAMRGAWGPAEGWDLWRHARHMAGHHRRGGPPFRGRPGGGRGRFPFGGFPGPGGLPGPGFPRRGRAGRGDVRAAALSLLAEEPLHGYQIMQVIAERTGGSWQPSPGSVYPALQQLEDEGLIRAEPTDGRRVFDLTGDGRTYVDEHREELDAVWQMAGGAHDEAVWELRDLVGQVVAATMQVAHAASEAQLAEARQVLDETRRRLYRILADGDPGTGDAAGDENPEGGEA